MEVCAYCKKELDQGDVFYYKNLVLCEDCFRNKKDEINANFEEIWEHRFDHKE